MLIRELLLVGIGGMAGSMARQLTVIGSIRWLQSGLIGLFTVNILGSFAAGMLLPMTGLSREMRWFLMSGFLGGYTTFSAFSSWMVDSVAPQQTIGHLLVAGAHVVLAVGAAYLGMKLGVKLRG